MKSKLSFILPIIGLIADIIAIIGVTPLINNPQSQDPYISLLTKYIIDYISTPYFMFFIWSFGIYLIIAMTISSHKNIVDKYKINLPYNVYLQHYILSFSSYWLWIIIIPYLILFVYLYPTLVLIAVGVIIGTGLFILIGVWIDHSNDKKDEYHQTIKKNWNSIKDIIENKLSQKTFLYFFDLQEVASALNLPIGLMKFVIEKYAYENSKISYYGFIKYKMDASYSYDKVLVKLDQSEIEKKDITILQ